MSTKARLQKTYIDNPVIRALIDDIVDELNCVQARYNIIELPWRNHSTNPPSFATYTDGAGSLGIEVLRFNTAFDQYVVGSATLPYDYKEGTAPIIQVVYRDYADAGSNSLRFQLEYIVVDSKNLGVFPIAGATTVQNKNLVPSGSSQEFSATRFNLGTTDAAGNPIGHRHVVFFRFGRNGTHAADKYTRHMVVPSIHLLYQVDDVRGSEDKDAKYL